MVATALIAVINLYGPGLQHVFGTTPIPGMFWGLSFCFPVVILIMDELRKLIVRTYPKVSRGSVCFGELVDRNALTVVYRLYCLVMYTTNKCVTIRFFTTVITIKAGFLPLHSSWNTHVL